ncbi:MAG: hypothetical protein U0324_13890 [Polyangiales bacterium]
MTAARWTFDTTAAPRAAQVMLLVFGEGARAAPEVPGVAVRPLPRAADPAWFDAWRAGSIRAVAEADLRGDLAALDRADHVHVVIAEPAAATDLAHLQGAWAAARALLEAGASAALDVHALAWRTAATAPDPAAPLDLDRELRLVFEGAGGRADGAYPLHTRGLRKFGAPDLVALCSPGDAELVGDMARQLAHAMARGLDLARPRHALALGDAATWYAVDDVRSRAPRPAERGLSSSTRRLPPRRRRVAHRRWRRPRVARHTIGSSVRDRASASS